MFGDSDGSDPCAGANPLDAPFPKRELTLSSPSPPPSRPALHRFPTPRLRPTNPSSASSGTSSNCPRPSAGIRGAMTPSWLGGDKPLLDSLSLPSDAPPVGAQSFLLSPSHFLPSKMASYAAALLPRAGGSFGGSRGGLHSASRPERILREIVSDSVPAMMEVLQDLPSETLEVLREMVRRMILDPEKRDELASLQRKLERRSDLTAQVLVFSNKTQLEILMAIKTGNAEFVTGKRRVSASELVATFLTRCLTYELLKEITDNFSKEREVGAGAFGKVYRGVSKNGEEIAVKLLYDARPGLDDQQFHNEFYNLKLLKHQNIVRFVGYCYETQEVPAEYNGRVVLAEKTYRALCFEYLQNGNLKRHLSDELGGLDWDTRYKIIKGTCKGLKYIHKGLGSPIYHLDLKPENILLDKNMVPKLADFGLSKIFGEDGTRTTANFYGTRGYIPPEYIERNVISNKFDIFSLGVVLIKIVTGPMGYTKSADMPPQEFIDRAQEKWRNRLKAKWSGSFLDAYCEQVKICIEIALNCVEKDRYKRPTIVDIINKLNEMENLINKFNIDPLDKRLYQQMHWKIRSLNDPNRNTIHQYAQDPSNRNAEQMFHRSRFQQDIIGATPSNYYEENSGTGDSQLYRHDNEVYSADGDPLPGIEGFQIVGEPRPGSTLRACGFPTNGTTLCNFQWVRYLEDGTRQPIEGATMYDYVVTADDVGTLLAVDCTPMDDNGCQGDLMREFTNNENKITCDPEMQNEIYSYISNGRADFDVLVLQAFSPEEWELATLVLRRPDYQIIFKHSGVVVINEKYSSNLQTKIPNGRTTQFVLVSSGGAKLPLNTQGNDVRLRDLIVLVMRTFQNKALDAKRKGKV